MKKILIILISISQFFSFAQNGEKNQNDLHLKIFNPVIEINEDDTTRGNEIFEEILKSIYIVPTNNSEGKFALYESYQKELLDAYFLSSKNNREIVRKEAKKNTKKRSSIIIDNYSEFINKIIAKAYKNEFQNYKIILEQIDEVNNKTDYLDNQIQIKQDKLNKKIAVDDNINIEIGQNIYKYINKIYKSELDKTLNNSINLLVVNW